MFRSLGKIWWLLALSGIADAVCAVANLLMLSPDGSPALRRFALPDTVWQMSMLALVAGVCAISAGLWNYGRGCSWLLSLHGLALAAFGLIGLSPLIRGPLSFRPVSLLFVVMSVSVAAFAWRSAQTAPVGARGRRWLSVAGIASIGYALSFVVVGFGRIRLEPHSFWIWMCSYFSFCAIFMLCLALGARSQGSPQSGSSEVLPPAGSPRHAH